MTHKVVSVYRPTCGCRAVMLRKEADPSGSCAYFPEAFRETDKYDGALRYVWRTQPPAEPTEKDIRTHLFNAILVLNGYAQVATYRPT